MSVLLLFFYGIAHGNDDNDLPIANFEVISDFAEKIAAENESANADYYLWEVRHGGTALIRTVTNDLLFSAAEKAGETITVYLHAFSKHHPDKPSTHSETLTLKQGASVDIKSANILLCGNEYATTYEVDEQDGFEYDWEVHPTNLVASLAGEETDKLTVNWGSVEPDTVQAVIQLTLTSGGGSAYHFFRDVLLLPEVVPPDGEIIRKAESSNLLIAPIEDHEKYLYNWKSASLDTLVNYNFWEFESIDADNEYMLNIISRRFRFCTSTRNYMLHEGETTGMLADKMDQVETDMNQVGMLVYPNPTGGDVNLQFNHMEFEHARISVYNLSGQLVHKESINSHNGNETICFGIPESRHGVYFLHVELDNGLQFFEKIIVR